MKAYYLQDILDIEKHIGVGEVLTEKTHVYNNYGLILRPFEITSYYAPYFRNYDLSWTHPTTGKTYNFYKEIDTYGGGVLYVRPVSNSNR